MTTGTRDGKGKALVTEESPAGLGVWRRSVRERRDDGVQRKRKGEGVARPSAAAPPCLKTWGLDLQVPQEETKGCSTWLTSQKQAVYPHVRGQGVPDHRWDY